MDITAIQKICSRKIPIDAILILLVLYPTEFYYMCTRTSIVIEDLMLLSLSRPHPINLILTQVEECCRGPKGE